MEGLNLNFRCVHVFNNLAYGVMAVDLIPVPSADDAFSAYTSAGQLQLFVQIGGPADIFEKDGDYEIGIVKKER